MVVPPKTPSPRWSSAIGPVGAVEIARRFPRACGIPQEFQAIVDPALWDPHERQARQLPRGQAPNEDAIDPKPQHVGGTHSKPGRTKHINRFHGGGQGRQRPRSHSAVVETDSSKLHSGITVLHIVQALREKPAARASASWRSDSYIAGHSIRALEGR